MFDLNSMHRYIINKGSFGWYIISPTDAYIGEINSSCTLFSPSDYFREHGEKHSYLILKNRNF